MFKKIALGACRYLFTDRISVFDLLVICTAFGVLAYYGFWWTIPVWIIGSIISGKAQKGSK